MERPSRSDAQLSKEEATQIEAETREYFDGLAPKRHAKPQRSEYSSQYIDAISSDQNEGVIPEYVEFQHLEKDDSQKLVYNGCEVPDEFVETEYYKDLTGIDKQHHTSREAWERSVWNSGTGFIKMEDTKNKPFSLDTNSTTDLHASCKGNPATNDWIPASDDTMDFICDKPSRSDN